MFPVAPGDFTVRRYSCRTDPSPSLLRREVPKILGEMADDLSDRARDVLKVVVREFIHKGDPVGSSHLSQLPDFDVSSATMRNVLAELEELGYLEKPHTSAGRVPTVQGYRFFVNSM